MDCFKYLGSQVAAGGGFEVDVVWMRGISVRIAEKCAKKRRIADICDEVSI